MLRGMQDPPTLLHMKQTITTILEHGAHLRASLVKNQGFIDGVAQAAGALLTTIQNGGTIYACGNGGSSCDAMHLVEELVARYKRERPGIRAQHFVDPSILTCWSNDYSFDAVFERQAETFCGPHDSLIAISTSGNSRNVVAAAKVAQRKGSTVIGLLGRDGGELASLCAPSIIVPSNETERIQEIHITVIHILCELIETAPAV